MKYSVLRLIELLIDFRTATNSDSAQAFVEWLRHREFDS